MLKGDYLFIAGNSLYNRLNQPAKRLPFALAEQVERLDVVGYLNFYGGVPALAWRRLAKGVHNILTDRVRVQECGRLREISVRKLHLPQPLEMTLQTRWIERWLRPWLRPRYRVGIVSGPENCWIAERLVQTGTIEHLIYYDTDHFPSYVAPPWSDIADHQERRLITLADGVVSVSTPLADLRRQQGSRASIVINNGVAYDLLSQAYVKWIPHPFTLIYTGSLDLRWGVDLAIEAMPAISAQVPDARLVIIGDGVDEARLKALAQRVGAADHIIFTGRLDYEALPNWLAQADIGIATSRPNAFRQYASPMKIADYLAAGLVVLCSGGGDGARLVHESGSGMCVEANAQAIADAAIMLARNRELLERMSARAVIYARDLSWARCGERLAEFMAQLAPEGRIV